MPKLNTKDPVTCNAFSFMKMIDVNNKLQCDGFIQIQFAPPRETIREKDFNRIFLINNPGGETVVAKLVSFLRVDFDDIGDVFTIPATGMDSFEWTSQWLQKYPDTTKETKMAVYCYQRLK